MHAYGHNVADSWLLKDYTESNEVMESGNEFHYVIVHAVLELSRGTVEYVSMLGSSSPELWNFRS